MGSGGEVTQSEPVKMPVPKKATQIHKTGANVSGLFQTNFNRDISSNDPDKVDRTVALTSHFSGDLQELDEKCNSMMEKTSRKKENGNILYRCKVCGKEAINGDLKKHVEANHLEGVSIPCNDCEKTFRSRKTLKYHLKEHQ